MCVMASSCSVTVSNVILLTILYFVSHNPTKGDFEGWRIKVSKGNNGECSSKFQIETFEETYKHIEPCFDGLPGITGLAGQKGDKGERGEVGEKGKCEEKGTEANPATSCIDSNKNDNPYIFPASPFKVNCDYLFNRICFNNTKEVIKIDEEFNITKEEPYWLWPDAAKEDFFEKFYGLKKSQISHLISISDRTSLNLIIHCKNFELKNNIKILLWDNNLIGQTASSTSPVVYNVPEDLNGCQNFLDPNEWRTAIISIDTWLGAAKNFFIPAKTLEDQGFYIQLQNICFYF